MFWAPVIMWTQILLRLHRVACGRSGMELLKRQVAAFTIVTNMFFCLDADPPCWPMCQVSISRTLPRPRSITRCQLEDLTLVFLACLREELKASGMVADGGDSFTKLNGFRALLLANSQPRLHSQTGDTVVLVMSDARSIAVADGVAVPPLDPEVLGVSSVPGSVRCLCSAGSTGTPHPDIDNAQFLQHTCDGTLVREDCGCADIDVWSQLRSAVHCSDHGGYGGPASAAPENERSLDIKTDTHITTQHLPLLRTYYRQAFPLSEHVL